MSIKYVIGIDPGANTGIAIYVRNKLDILETYPPLDAIRLLQKSEFTANQKDLLVVMEDSRLQSVVFKRTNIRGGALSHESQLKIARDIGRIDMICTLLEDTCLAKGYSLIRLSPKQKGGKVNSETFCKKTGWEGKSNQHERDAGMVAFPFRHGAKL